MGTQNRLAEMGNEAKKNKRFVGNLINKAEEELASIARKMKISTCTMGLSMLTAFFGGLGLAGGSDFYDKVLSKNAELPKTLDLLDTPGCKESGVLFLASVAAIFASRLYYNRKESQETAIKESLEDLKDVYAESEDYSAKIAKKIKSNDKKAEKVVADNKAKIAKYFETGEIPSVFDKPDHKVKSSHEERKDELKKSKKLEEGHSGFLKNIISAVNGERERIIGKVNSAKVRCCVGSLPVVSGILGLVENQDKLAKVFDLISPELDSTIATCSVCLIGGAIVTGKAIYDLMNNQEQLDRIDYALYNQKAQRKESLLNIEKINDEMSDIKAHKEYVEGSAGDCLREFINRQPHVSDDATMEIKGEPVEDPFEFLGLTEGVEGKKNEGQATVVNGQDSIDNGQGLSDDTPQQ